MNKVNMTLIILALANVTYGQDFVNLNFENAVIVADHSSPYYPNAVNAASAIPGWTSTGFLAPNDIVYNTTSLGSTSVSIYGAAGDYKPLEGEYSIGLYGGGTMATGASISQTGFVPVDANSILFAAQYSGPPGGTLLVSLNDQNITFSSIYTGPNYTLYGGDISAFAGQVKQLRFTAPEGGNNYWEIDNIHFSPQVIPEPNSCVLFAIGALAIAGRFVRDKRC